jgi:lysophospholipase L1-like esterase
MVAPELVGKALSDGERQARNMLDSRMTATASLAPPGSSGLLVAEGDSWFDYPGSDILDVLEDVYGYDVNKVAKAGDTVEQMAYQDWQLAKFIRVIEKIAAKGREPRAVLLSAGGNDVAGDPFETLLNFANAPDPGLNAVIADEFIEGRIQLAYVRIISAITTVCRDRFGKAVPIVTHGYDYAVPDGRGLYWMGPWLDPGFRAKGYLDMDVRGPVVVDLIDRFNAMLAGLGSLPDLSHVHYVNLRGSLPNAPEVYREWWANELHPSDAGFREVGRQFADVLAALP